MLIAVAQKRRFGFINESGDLIVDFIYRGGNDSVAGFATVVSRRGFGCINESGGEVVAPQYKWIAHGFSEGRIGVQVKHRWGFLDESGEMCIDPKYEFVGDFSEGLTYAGANGDTYIIDLQGQQRFRNPHAGLPVFNEGRAIVESHESHVNGYVPYGAIDERGELVVPLDYFDLSPFDKDVASAMVVRGDRIAGGCIDNQGKVLVDFVFRGVSNFVDGVAAAMLDDEDRVVLIDSSGQVLHETRFVSFQYEFVDGLLPVQAANGLWCYMNHRGEAICDAQYEEADAFSCGFGCVALAGRYGFVNTSGERVVPTQYVEVEGRFRNGVVRCVDDRGDRHILGSGGQALWIERK